ncbi:MAG: outer membrane beta-barrel protein [Gemmataceae bacterium]
MKKRHALRLAMALLVGHGANGFAQQPSPIINAPPPITNVPAITFPAANPQLSGPSSFGPTTPFERATRRASGLEPESLPGELREDVASGPGEPRLGATPVSDVRLLMDGLGLADLFGDSGIRMFGWLEAGYQGASTGSGLLNIQPRLPRFGNEFLVNQIGLVMQKPLSETDFDIGFNIRYYAGADAFVGQPKGGIGDTITDERFSHDFRDLYISAHLPIITDGGVNIKVGRMNTIIGYNGYLAPYRPFYTSDYQFFYSQDGAFTGALAQLIVNDRLDVWSGITLGANTFFTRRSENSYCYIGQMNYWLQEAQKTRLTASVYAGPDAIFAAPGMNGDFVTMVELRLQQNWNRNFTQIVQSNMGWDNNTPVGTGQWYGLYTICIFHLDEQWDLNFRAEWFDDVNGTRTGIATNYEAVTLGCNWHPTSYLEVRPEIRGDFADRPAFGGGGEAKYRNQLTGGISALLKF